MNYDVCVLYDTQDGKRKGAKTTVCFNTSPEANQCRIFSRDFSTLFVRDDDDDDDDQQCDTSYILYYIV